MLSNWSYISCAFTEVTWNEKIKTLTTPRPRLVTHGQYALLFIKIPDIKCKNDQKGIIHFPCSRLQNVYCQICLNLLNKLCSRVIICPPVQLNKEKHRNQKYKVGIFARLTNFLFFFFLSCKYTLHSTFYYTYIYTLIYLASNQRCSSNKHSSPQSWLFSRFRFRKIMWLKYSVAKIIVVGAFVAHALTSVCVAITRDNYLKQLCSDVLHEVRGEFSFHSSLSWSGRSFFA